MFNLIKKLIHHNDCQNDHFEYYHCTPFNYYTLYKDRKVYLKLFVRTGGYNSSAILYTMYLLESFIVLMRECKQSCISISSLPKQRFNCVYLVWYVYRTSLLSHSISGLCKSTCNMCMTTVKNSIHSSITMNDCKQSCIIIRTARGYYSGSCFLMPVFGMSLLMSHLINNNRVTRRHYYINCAWESEQYSGGANIINFVDPGYGQRK